jgi:hypothetical protein
LLFLNEWNINYSRQTSTNDISRRSSVSSTTSSTQSPRSSQDGTTTKITRSNGPLRAFATDPSTTTKPRLSIYRKVPTVPTTTKSTTPVLVRLGSIKQQDLLKKYPSLNTTTTPTTKSTKPRETSPARINSADKFRRMVLDCRETSSWMSHYWIKDDQSQHDNIVV